mmetsp:Transcript_44438/g.125461  ORF Transcript_44438/g.125461 Transcript_44438/m.125461 type:complete len:91 (-) Transcript_44438:332-604(-)
MPIAPILSFPIGLFISPPTMDEDIFFGPPLDALRRLLGLLGMKESDWARAKLFIIGPGFVVADCMSIPVLPVAIDGKDPAEDRRSSTFEK